MKLEDTALANVMDLIWEVPEPADVGIHIDRDELQQELDSWEECPDPETMMSIAADKRVEELQEFLYHTDQYSTIVPEEHIDEYLIDALQSTYSYDPHLESYIDWADMADDAKGDYTVVEFDGDTYYISP